jgi:hypothetical protein
VVGELRQGLFLELDDADLVAFVSVRKSAMQTISLPVFQRNNVPCAMTTIDVKNLVILLSKIKSHVILPVTDAPARSCC